MTAYLNVGKHFVDLEDGRVVGVGQEVELSEEDLESEHNSALVEGGTLIPSEE